MQQTLLHAQKQQWPCSSGNLIFSASGDDALRRIAPSERFSALQSLQQLTAYFPSINLVDNFGALARAVFGLPAAERAALPALCAPLFQALAGAEHEQWLANILMDLCTTPVAERAERVQALVGEAIAQGTGTNVHEGVRDTRARAAAKSLWFGAGLRAREPQVAPTFAAIAAFVEALRQNPLTTPAYLTVPIYDGQSHLQRAAITLQSLTQQPGIFTLDIESRQEVSLAELVSMFYYLIDQVQEGSAEQTKAKHLELRRHLVAALSDSLARKGGSTYCAQGVVQRLLTPLQGYFPEVRLDAFGPPTEGDFVSEFARSLSRMLEQAAPGTDLKQLAREEAAAALARAETVYAPVTDDLTFSEAAAEQQKAAASIVTIGKDIAAYLAYEELV